MHDTTFAVAVSVVGVTIIFGLVLIVNAFVARSKEERKNHKTIN